MNQQKWKEFITKRNTIWTASLCLVGVIVLGGIASVNSSRDDADRQSGTQTGQLAYLEEELGTDDNNESLSADDNADLEEVSGNIIENNTSETITGSGDSDSSSISASGDNSSDAASVSGDSASDTASADDSSEAASASDMTSASTGDISGAASEAASGGDTSDAASEAASSGGDTSDAASEAASSGGDTSDAASEAASSGGDTSDAVSTTASDSVEEASSSDILSEAALIDAGISFTDEQSILWPSAGTIIIDYSMDKSVYFSTLNQYKYNPALIISSATGNQVLASARGIIESITIDEETGTTLVLNIGNGYKLTYGQLMETAVSEGDIVEAGDLLAYISEPTKYYCTEGSNLYFAMTKDGEPVDPVLYLE